MAATTLYGMTWFGDDTPTTGVIGGQDWRRPTSGEWWVRNTSNTDWTYMGNMNNNGLGAVQTAGDTVTGPLNGVPNLLPTTDPDVSGTITENGFPLATELSLSQLQKFIMTQLKSMVRAQFLSQTKLSGTATNIAFLSGYSGLLSYTTMNGWNGSNPTTFAGFIIPYATFKSDGLQATSDQELDYGWALTYFSPGIPENYMGLAEVNATGSALSPKTSNGPGSRRLGMVGDWGSGNGSLAFIYWSLCVR